MPKVFTTTPARRYSLFSSTYPKEGLQDLVEVYLKDRTLADLDKHVIVTSFKARHEPFPPPSMICLSANSHK